MSIDTRVRWRRYCFGFNTVSIDETPNIEAINKAAALATEGVKNPVKDAAREVVSRVLIIDLRAFNPSITRNIVVVYIDAFTEGTAQYEHEFVFKVGKNRISSISQGLSHDGLGYCSTIQIPV